MLIVKISDVSKSFGDNEVFNKIKLDINSGEKIGIVGTNGSGKTTLIKMILGLEEPSSGKIEVFGNNNIGYLKQATEYTVDDFIEMTSDKKMISEFLRINSELNLSSNIDFSRERLENLSGGEKTKIALSSILAYEPNILILDEPTNHVDMESIEWIISKLKTYKGTLIVVSHDRYFLNQTISKILEVDRGNLKVYFGNYDDYKKQKDEELESLKNQYEMQQKQEKKIKREIDKLKQWSEKGEKEAGRQGGSMSDAKVKGVKTNAQRKAAKIGRSAENKKVRLEQMRKDYIDKPFESKDIKFSFNGADTGANCLIRINGLSKAYNGESIFSDVNLSINRNEKIALVGPNGSGKTTFIKIIMDKENMDKGEVWKTPSLKVAYMSQDVFDLDESKTIFEMGNDYESEKRQYFFSNLVNMGYDRNQFKNKVSTLSLGQRMRLKLVQIILDDYNLLVLDEPTNHLDLENKIELENALIKFPGALIIASHDRYLLSKVTNKTFAIENNKILRYEEGFEEYSTRATKVDYNLDATSVSNRLRDIEEKMADPTATNEEIEKLLEEYYELLALDEQASCSKKR